MTSHSLPITVQIFDTDCYGVMWHGAYVKWLEQGRVALFEQLGVPMGKPEDPDALVFPVTEQCVRFRSPARLWDKLRLVTTARTMGRSRVVFEQVCHDDTTGKITIEATTTIAVLDGGWKPVRQLPEVISQVLGVAASLAT